MLLGGLQVTLEVQSWEEEIEEREGEETEEELQTQRKVKAAISLDGRVLDASGSG